MFGLSKRERDERAARKVRERARQRLTRSTNGGWYGGSTYDGGSASWGGGSYGGGDCGGSSDGGGGGGAC